MLDIFFEMGNCPFSPSIVCIVWSISRQTLTLASMVSLTLSVCTLNLSSRKTYFFM